MRRNSASTSGISWSSAFASPSPHAWRSCVTRPEPDMRAILLTARLIPPAASQFLSQVAHSLPRARAGARGAELPVAPRSLASVAVQLAAFLLSYGLVAAAP